MVCGGVADLIVVGGPVVGLADLPLGRVGAALNCLRLCAASF